MLEGIGEGLAGAGVPDPCGVVQAGGADAHAVWAERRCSNHGAGVASSEKYQSFV
jgi:hypothetical protein